jgi:nucleoside permease NupC
LFWQLRASISVVKDKKMVVAPKLTINEFRALTSFKNKIENILKNDPEIVSFFCMCVVVDITSIKRLLTPCIAFWNQEQIMY